MDSEYNYLFKVVLIGDSGVGKSNLMTRYTSDDFSQNSPSTIGVEFMTKTVKCDQRDVKVQIWDTAGQERFRAIARSIYHGAKGAMVVFDITNQQSFDHIPSWLNELRQHVPQNTVIMLIGNKCDLNHQRAVASDVAQKFAQDYGISFLETSALDNTNVDKAFEWLVQAICNEMHNPKPTGGAQPGRPQVTGTTVTLPPGEQPRPQKKGCCGGKKDSK